MSISNSLMGAEFDLASWTQALKRSPLQDMLHAASHPGVISFALGLPARELFPIATIGRLATQILQADPYALQYGPSSGRLKQQIVTLMAELGVSCTAEQIFLTAGAQQGVNLLARLLLNPGGQLISEDMIYTGFQQVIAPFEPQILTVSTDPETGINVDEVEALLLRGARPAFMYVMSNGHNPLTVSMSPATRTRLVQLAREYRFPLIEDDPYGFLYYEQTKTPPLRALDEKWVLYVGSFSKILAPALRAGWIIVPPELISHLSIVKEAADIDTATFAQRLISAYLETGQLAAHMEELRSEYGIRRDAMLRSLKRHFPREATWTSPTSGIFIWVELPGAIDTIQLLQLALETEKVAFIPGKPFCMNGGTQGSNCLRLNFSSCAPDRIEEGIARLGRVLERVA